MSTQYQVIAECAHVVVADVSGVKSTHLLYKGAFLPDDVEPDRLTFLVDGGFVSEVGEVPLAPNASVEQDPRTGADSVTTERLQGQSDAEIEAKRKADAEAADKAKADAEVTEKRVAAQVKLAELGGKVPDGRASQPVLVEWLAGQGGLYDDLAKADKSELLDLIKQRQQS